VINNIRLRKCYRIHLVKLTICILGLLFARSAFAQETYIYHFTTKEGLLSNNCYYTLQDKRGYIWIGTDAGVSRFDGRRFENFSVDDGLSDNQILQINEDRIGRIWFLSLNGQLSYFYNGKIYNESNDKLLKILKFNAIIVSFFEDSKGRLWFGTNKNILYMWDGMKLRNFVSTNLSAQFINCFIHEDQKGKIWAYSMDCVRVFSGESFSLVADAVLPISYKTILNLRNKNLLYLAKDGLFYNDISKTSLVIKLKKDLLIKDPGYFYANRKELWLSNNDGVYHMDATGKTIHYLDRIPTSQVLKDDKDNMWFTTTNGIYMLPKTEDRLYKLNVLKDNKKTAVKSILKDSANRLWLGLDDGAINILNKHKILVDQVKFKDQATFQKIKQLSIAQNKKSLYFASDYGIGAISDIFAPVKNIAFLRETNQAGYVVKNFSINGSSAMAIALSSGVTIIKDRLKNFEFTSSNFKEGTNFFNNRSYNVFYDQHQSLWFSNINGLSKFSGRGLNTLYQEDLLLSKRINAIRECPDGTLVLATDGYGLIFLKNNKIVNHITQKEGLANNICKGLFVKGNEIWVITNNGINRIFKDGVKLDVESFEYTNALLKNDVNDLYIDKDTAYFATNNGLVYFYNKPADQLKEVPKVWISSVSVNNVLQDLNGRKMMLDPFSNNLVFRYNTIDFQNQEMSFKYRLKDNLDWVETKNRRIEFSSLSPGNYKFELSARSSNSKWSDPVSVSFELEAHFWETIWFLAILFSIAAILFYKLAVVITKKQKDKEQQQLLLKNKILMLEQRALQAMMSPHFVFNVMNSIQHYINTKDTSSANKVLTGFARLIRKNLEIVTKSFITLEEEIEYLELYLTLEKKRFGEKFQYHFEIDSKIDKEETFLPSMLLQPYIENAIWHGIMPKEEGGKIEILITGTDDNYLLIKIVDNGIGINNSYKNKSSNHHESKGMNLTQERINLLNQIEVKPIHINIQQNGNSGTTVAIKVPN
jgi:ligand-binding sensor domain-containing protein